MIATGTPSMKLYITNRYFVLQTLHLAKKAQLVLERRTGRCFCTSDFNPLEGHPSDSQIHYLEVFSLIGIFPIEGVLHIAVTTEADVVDSLDGHNIYDIKEVELIEFEEVRAEHTESLKKDLAKLLVSGFYFSYYFDLTCSLQRAGTKEGNLHERADPRYYWNLEGYKDLLAQSVDTQWCIPIIQGYVGIQKFSENGMHLTLGLISRRSCEKVGTRYNCRGIDDEGSVANYVETEQILVIDDKKFSYIQTRGSVPLFWEQTGMTSAISLTRSTEMNYHTFTKHINNMIRDYGHVTLINLLYSEKAHERLLTENWELIINKYHKGNPNNVAYRYFDFHAHCRGQRYYKINDLLENIEDLLGYYLFYLKKDQVEATQKGVFRTNCLDCLDRTNVVQSFIAWKSLTTQMKMAGLDFTLRLEDSDQYMIGKHFKTLWAENADALSIQYTGAASTISSYTREGKQGIKGLIKHSIRSFGRFYSANMEDSVRQRCIDTLLKRTSVVGLVNKIEQEVEERKDEYSTYSNISVRMVTWNMGGNPLSDTSSLSRLFIGSEAPADILIVSVQEIIKLNVRSVIQTNSNSGAFDRMKNLIEMHLNASGAEYHQVSQKELIGCCLFIYAQSSVFYDIKKVQRDKVKVGFRGKTGNKGAVIVRFDIKNTSICVLNCHLASGTDQNDTRKSQLLDILHKGFQQKSVAEKTYSILNHDVVFVSGDLNFRVLLSNYEVREHVNQGKFAELMQAEQLTQTLKTSAFREFTEAEIAFQPTYKYDVGTDTYDTSKKARTPAWCDRILYKGPGITPLSYNSDMSFMDSDHKPVVGLFSLPIKQTNIDKKNQLYSSLYASFNKDAAR